MPVYQSLIDNGVVSRLMTTETALKTAPSADHVLAEEIHQQITLYQSDMLQETSIIEKGQKPGDGQLANVALMDARSIAATAINKGYIIVATELEGLSPEEGNSTLEMAYEKFAAKFTDFSKKDTLLVSTIYAIKSGDGSAR
jgi:aconitate hydratase